MFNICNVYVAVEIRAKTVAKRLIAESFNFVIELLCRQSSVKQVTDSGAKQPAVIDRPKIEPFIFAINGDAVDTGFETYQPAQKRHMPPAPMFRITLAWRSCGRNMLVTLPLAPRHPSKP